MTKRLSETGTIHVDPATKVRRICLISEGQGSSGDYTREFFTQANADALAGSLSFPGHPMDIEHPEHRNPLSAVASIGDTVTIEEHQGKLSFWSEYNVSKSRPDVGTYLDEYGHKLGLSVYIDSDGHNDSATGRWIAESLVAEDPYKSVDLVVAPGARGGFERVAEGLRRIQENASATPQRNEEENDMEIKELAEDFDKKFTSLTKTVESLVSALEGESVKAAQVKADDAAVEKAVESRVTKYDEAVEAITKAELPESFSKTLRESAIKGEDITEKLAEASKLVESAREGFAPLEGDDEDRETHRSVESHRPSTHKSESVDLGDLAGFGQVS